MNASAQAGSAEQPGPLTPSSVFAQRFRIEAALGADGGTWLYRARDLTDSDEVILRIVPHGSPGADRAVLAADLQRASQLTHKNFLRLVAFGEADRAFYVASEACDGHKLREIIDAARAQGKTVGAQAAYTLIGHLAQALEEAYRFLPHGAISPSAIYVARAGRPMLADFGLARGLPALARRGAPAGAPDVLYVAPEAQKGSPASAATDVYALAVVLHELLTGVPPRGPQEPPSRLAAGVPHAVDAVFARALSPLPASRQPTPAQLVTELGAALGLAPATGHTPVQPMNAAAGRATGNLAVPRVTGRTFNAAEAAGLDADTERWLIQKDRLDYGPFSMAQVRAEIERGNFRGDHVLVDTESGERVLLKDHPQLGAFAKQAERTIEAKRRAQAEQHLEVAEKKKSRVMILVVGAAIAVLGAGGFLYMQNRKAGEADVLASRVGEEDIDAFLRGVKVNFAQARKKPAVRRAAGSSAGGRDEFSNDMVLGDVTKGGGDEVLSDDEIQKTMMGNYRKLVPCIMDEKRRSPGTTDFDIEFVVQGSGKVSAVRVNGVKGSPLSACVLGRMQGFGFRRFNGAKTIASWSLSIR